MIQLSRRLFKQLSQHWLASSFSLYLSYCFSSCISLSKLFSPGHSVCVWGGEKKTTIITLLLLIIIIIFICFIRKKPVINYQQISSSVQQAKTRCTYKVVQNNISRPTLNWRGCITISAFTGGMGREEQGQLNYLINRWCSCSLWQSWYCSV